MTDFDKHIRLFDLIAPVYNMFFQSQVRGYRGVLAEHLGRFKLPQGGRVLDIGCGTGALLYCFAELGYKVKGVDASTAMVRQAAKSTAGFPVELQVGDAAQGLPFESESFDLVISSLVLHGLPASLRQKIYREAARLSRGLVIFYEYNRQRSFLSDVVEWAEGGDYFNFIQHGHQEMSDAFSRVEVIDVAPQRALYLCTP